MRAERQGCAWPGGLPGERASGSVSHTPDTRAYRTGIDILKEKCHEMNNIIEGLKNQIGSFYLGANGDVKTINFTLLP